MTVRIPGTRECPSSQCDLIVTTGERGWCIICNNVKTAHLREREEKVSPRYEGGHDADVPVLHFVCLSPNCQEAFDE